MLIVHYYEMVLSVKRGSVVGRIAFHDSRKPLNESYIVSDLMTLPEISEFIDAWHHGEAKQPGFEGVWLADVARYITTQAPI